MKYDLGIYAKKLLCEFGFGSYQSIITLTVWATDQTFHQFSYKKKHAHTHTHSLYKKELPHGI
jgi:heme-degrading monooxygenase HmoA